MAWEDWERFRQNVLADQALQERLRATRDWAAFVALALQLGAERGLTLSVADLERALQSGRRLWLERWLAD